MVFLFNRGKSLLISSLFVLGRQSSCYAFSPTNAQSGSFSSTALSMTKKVLVPIADGSEEIETTCITDTLTRFGAKVTIASVMKGGELLCTMSRGIKVMADMTIDDAVKEEWDLVALPGGMPGAEHLRDSEPLIALLEKQKADPNKYYGAICAAPAVALASKGLIDSDAKATCYPAPVFRDVLGKDIESNDKVVVSKNNLVTSQGPGTSLLFGLQLGELLYGKEARDKIANAMLS